MLNSKKTLPLLVLIGTWNVLTGTAHADLVAHWTFNEGGGATAYDSAGTNDGTLVNSPTWASGAMRSTPPKSARSTQSPRLSGWLTTPAT